MLKLKTKIMENVQNDIINWATEKGIFEHATTQTQFMKLQEECAELETELHISTYSIHNRDEVLLEFGDVLVVLTILAKQLDTDFETCLAKAYEKIKNRTGKMVGGTFVKD